MRSKAAKVMFSQASVILSTGGSMQHGCTPWMCPPAAAWMHPHPSQMHPPDSPPAAWMHPLDAPLLLQHGYTPDAPPATAWMHPLDVPPAAAWMHPHPSQMHPLDSPHAAWMHPLDAPLLLQHGCTPPPPRCTPCYNMDAPPWCTPPATAWMHPHPSHIYPPNAPPCPLQQKIDRQQAVGTHPTGMHTCFIAFCRYLGVDEQLLLFEFKNFQIGVRASVNVTDPNQIRIDASSPYQRNFNISQQTIPQFNTKANRWTMQGQRPIQR